MPAPKSSRWSQEELAILDEVFPAEGVNAAVDHLPGRSWQAINVMASKRGLRSPVVGAAPQPRLRGHELEEAIRLREVEGWSFARIGATFGVAEISACNAVLIALCPRKGFTPAQRDSHGHLTSEGLDRVRLALRKGFKGVEIQLRLGVSASCVAEQRRRYQRDLKARGKAALPPPGGGEAYSGVRVAKAKRSEVEALFMQGLGTAKISTRVSISKTTCTRIRSRLIKRLKRKGECLPGCDIDGVRHVQAESTRFITPEQIAALRGLLLDRVPVSRAARMVAIGSCSAYRIRDVLAVEVAARGEVLPAPLRPGRAQSGATREADWPPHGTSEIYRFRSLLAEQPFDAAKETFIAARKADRQAAREAARRPKTFEEQLEAVRSGRVGLQRALGRAHLEPRYQPERETA